MAAQADLANAEIELEKQRALNEKLENDLLQIQAHNPAPKATANGYDTPAEDDVLAGLDLGKKPAVSAESPVAKPSAVAESRSLDSGVPSASVPEIALPSRARDATSAH